MRPPSGEPPRVRTRFLPPMAGGQQKTGWEALEKWVGSGGSGGAATDQAPASSGKKTGWEALEKWVGSGGSGQAAPAAEAAAPAPSGKTGWEALEKWVGSGGSGQAAPETAAASNGQAAADRLADSVEQQVGELREEVATLPASSEPAKSGGIGGFLKRLFGGK